MPRLSIPLVPSSPHPSEHLSTVSRPSNFMEPLGNFRENKHFDIRLSVRPARELKFSTHKKFALLSSRFGTLRLGLTQTRGASWFEVSVVKIHRKYRYRHIFLYSRGNHSQDLLAVTRKQLEVPVDVKLDGLDTRRPFSLVIYKKICGRSPRTTGTACRELRTRGPLSLAARFSSLPITRTAPPKTPLSTAVG
jgi:hypothetical protein